MTWDSSYQSVCAPIERGTLAAGTPTIGKPLAHELAGGLGIEDPGSAVVREIVAVYSDERAPSDCPQFESDVATLFAKMSMGPG